MSDDEQRKEGLPPRPQKHDDRPPPEPPDEASPGPQGPNESEGSETSAGYTHGPVETDESRAGVGDADTFPIKRSSKALMKPRGSELVPVLVSLLLPGVGQMMLGQKAKGLVVLLIGLLLLFGFGLYNIVAAVDAYCVAAAKKQRPVGDWELLPDIKTVITSAPGVASPDV